LDLPAAAFDLAAAAFDLAEAAFGPASVVFDLAGAAFGAAATFGSAEAKPFRFAEARAPAFAVAARLGTAPTLGSVAGVAAATALPLLAPRARRRPGARFVAAARSKPSCCATRSST
jgi:hypothetical protein